MTKLAGSGSLAGPHRELRPESLQTCNLVLPAAKSKRLWPVRPGERPANEVPYSAAAVLHCQCMKVLGLPDASNKRHWPHNQLATSLGPMSQQGSSQGPRWCQLHKLLRTQCHACCSLIRLHCTGTCMHVGKVGLERNRTPLAWSTSLTHTTCHSWISQMCDKVRVKNGKALSSSHLCQLATIAWHAVRAAHVIQ